MLGPVLLFSAREATLSGALGESAGLLDTAESRQVVTCGAWIVPDERAIVLGRMQHAGRVLERPDDESWSIVRRSSTGTAVAVDGALLVSLALPAIDAVFRDATMRTVINRNVRLLLAGLRSASVPAAYFGREWLSWQRRPLAVIGLEMTPSGAVLLEALFTLRGSLAVPRVLTTDAERSIDRYAGKTPARLEEAANGRRTEELARAIQEGIVERVGVGSHEIEPASSSAGVERVASPTSPLPPGSSVLPPRPVPIGWLDVARSPGGVWIGGDVLAPSFAMGLGRPPPDGAPMEGASWADVERARDAAR